MELDRFSRGGTAPSVAPLEGRWCHPHSVAPVSLLDPEVVGLLDAMQFEALSFLKPVGSSAERSEDISW